MWHNKLCVRSYPIGAYAQALRAVPRSIIFATIPHDGAGIETSTDAARYTRHNSDKIPHSRYTALGETCAEELRVQLPASMAAVVVEVQRREPQFLQNLLVYGLVRRTVFERLALREPESGPV